MRKTYLIAATLAAVLSSCSKSDESVLQGGVAGPIGFTSRMAHSRAGYVESGFADGDVIGVLGYEIPAPGVWQNSETPDVMHDARLVRQTYEGIANYVYHPLRMWPDAPSKARFFAYHPHSSSVVAGAITPSPASLGGYPYVKVILGFSADPIDFLVAQTKEIVNGTNERVALNFSHRLSKLKFKVKASGLETGVAGDERRVYLSQLKIKNAFNQSVYVFDADGGAWDEAQSRVEGLDAVSGATLKVSPIFAPLSSDWEDLIDPYGIGAYLLMIPQRRAYVELEVLYTLERVTEGGLDERVVSTQSIPISVDWKPGQEYTYYLEFAFSDIKGDGLHIGFTIADWEGREVSTEIE